MNLGSMVWFQTLRCTHRKMDDGDIVRTHEDEDMDVKAVGNENNEEDNLLHNLAACRQHDDHSGHLGNPHDDTAFDYHMGPLVDDHGAHNVIHHLRIVVRKDAHMEDMTHTVDNDHHADV